MYSRTDTGAWRQGLARCFNAICTSLGPVVRRPGSHYIAGSEDATEAHVVGILVDKDTAYFIGITDKPEIVFMNISIAGGAVVEQRITVDVPWPADQIPLLQFHTPPEGEVVYVVCPLIKMQALTHDPDEAPGDQWSIEEVSFTSQPPDWGADNWPSAITFFEGRLWLAGTLTSPQSFWGSDVGDWLDFSEAGSQPDEALSFTLAQRGKIEWLGATKNLLIGTANGEHIVDSEGGVIIPNDIHVTRQSSYGSNEVQALLIGNTITYVSPDGRKLRDVGYQWEENSWMSRDITFLSEHLTRLPNRVREMTWSQHPGNLIWCATQAGNMIGCTYEKSYDILGWHQHDTQGDYLSIASADVEGTSITLYATRRNPDEISFELLDPRHYMDSNVDVVPDGDLVFTAPHLADKLVQVTIGDAVHPDVQLDENGEGQLQYGPEPSRPEDTVTVGLGYLTEIETLPLDYTPEEPGTSAHFMKRWNKIYVRIFESMKPRVGKKTVNERPPERDPATPMNLPQPPVTEDVKVIGLGWDRFSQVYIQQDLPVPLTVTGIFGELSQNVDED